MNPWLAGLLVTIVSAAALPSAAPALERERQPREGFGASGAWEPSARVHPSTAEAASFVTLRVYEDIPLTQIAREVGTSVRMIEEHYAGVIANWDGKRVPAERQIRAERRTNGLTLDSNPKTKEARD
jgi:hypothetical protein